jgi:AraC-like DNA-binding protein
MYVCLKDLVVLRTVVDETSARKVIRSSRNVIRKSISRYRGRAVEKDAKRLIVSFTSAASAVMCALEMQNGIKSGVFNNKKPSFNIKITLTAGSPVTGRKELFGDTIILAERLCEVASKHRIVLSSTVKEAYNNEILDGLSRDMPLQSLSPDEERFIGQLIDTADIVWNDPKFSIVKFGKKVGMSKSQLYRKTVSVTGLSPNEFIREYRLSKALNMIEQQKGNVAQIAYETGFNSPSYFSKCFLKRYGTLPSSLASKLA